MIVKYELDALDIAKILAKHFGLELKDVHVETRKREYSKRCMRVQSVCHRCKYI